MKATPRTLMIRGLVAIVIALVIVAANIGPDRVVTITGAAFFWAGAISLAAGIVAWSKGRRADRPAGGAPAA